MKIRHLQENDIADFSEVYASCMNGAEINESWTQDTAERYIRWFYTQRPDLCFVAIINKQIAGGITALIKPYFHGNILIEPELFVHKSLRKQGIATKLVVTLLEYAMETYKITEINAYANKHTKFPLEWYRRLGFTESFWVHIGANPATVLQRLKLHENIS